MGELCQCPQRAYFHFYGKKEKKGKGGGKVSMPSTGLLPFLHTAQTNATLITDFVSMPSTGLLPFLHMCNLFGVDDFLMCQCPQRAYFHFYSENQGCIRSRSIVSMPSTGLLPFLRKEISTSEYMAAMCQCPQRAYFHFYGSLSESLILLASESYFYK